jgi:hypothetical protein
MTGKPYISYSMAIRLAKVFLTVLWINTPFDGKIAETRFTCFYPVFPERIPV